jgi:hypothetical protein
MNFALMHHHKYGLEVLEEMLPWERDIYVAMLIQYLDEKKNKEQNLNQKLGITDAH